MVSLSFVLCYKKNYEYDMMVDRIEDGQMVERIDLEFGLANHLVGFK
jgi:hypothetical protein